MLTSVPLIKPHWDLFVWTNIDSLPFFIAPILATTIRNRWAQWASAAIFLSLCVWWLFTFNSFMK